MTHLPTLQSRRWNILSPSVDMSSGTRLGCGPTEPVITGQCSATIQPPHTTPHAGTGLREDSCVTLSPASGLDVCRRLTLPGQCVTSLWRLGEAHKPTNGLPVLRKGAQGLCAFQNYSRRKTNALISKCLEVPFLTLELCHPPCWLPRLSLPFPGHPH